MAIDLDAAIEDAEAQIAELDRQREAAVTRLAELTDLRQGRERSADSGREPSSIAKVLLFADLFCGREDVIAVRWENAAKGRSATHHDVQTSGGQESARNRRSAVVPVSARRSPRSMCSSCLGISVASKSLGSIRCSPTTRAGCWRSISTATVAGRTRSCSSTCASRLASSLPSSVLGPAMAPMCGSSSRTRYPQQTHAGSGSQS
jgi:hypothetical protein